MLKKAKHKYIIQFEEAFTNIAENKLYIVMEKCDRKTVQPVIEV